MKQKFIITLHSVPYHDSKGKLRWDATEFNTLSFDEVGLERLEPYDEKLVEDLKKELEAAESSVKGAVKEMTDLKEEIDTLKKANSVIRSVNMGLVRQKHELEKKNEELTKQLKERMNSQYGVTGYKQGQTDLWEKLQDVKDMQPNEFDVECECLGDVIDMDLEDFLDAYKKWYEEKERLDRMRDHLEKFCFGRSCCGCPLNSDEFKCGMGLGFRPHRPGDKRIIPDEDVKKYYEKVRESRLPQTWECTIEGTLIVNGDVLGKVCGITIDDDK